MNFLLSAVELESFKLHFKTIYIIDLKRGREGVVLTSTILLTRYLMEQKNLGKEKGKENEYLIKDHRITSVNAQRKPICVGNNHIFVSFIIFHYFVC